MDAYCVYTLSDDERLIPSEEWAKMQVGRFSMDAGAFGAYQKFIEKACEKYKCTKEERQMRKKLLRKMEVLNEALMAVH